MKFQPEGFFARLRRRLREPAAGKDECSGYRQQEYEPEESIHGLSVAREHVFLDLEAHLLGSQG